VILKLYVQSVDVGTAQIAPQGHVVRKDHFLFPRAST
jgi:hypothetical protein